MKSLKSTNTGSNKCHSKRNDGYYFRTDPSKSKMLHPCLYYKPNFSFARFRKVWGLIPRRRAAASRLPSFFRIASS
jgi:hypothetical protein